MNTLLPPEVWQAARLAAGEQVPEASAQAKALASAALAAQDREVVADIADHYAAQYVPSGKKGPRVSDVDTCGRQVWYREHPPEDYTPRHVDERRATMGSVIHRAGQDARQARYPWRRYEFEIAIPGLARPGRIDEYDPVLGLVVDLKSAGQAKWAMVGVDGPPAAAWKQAGIYGLALEAAGLPVRTLRVIVVDRDTGREEPFDEPYDPWEAQEALNELVTLATMLELGVVPPREGDSPSRFPCSWCPAVAHCWNVDAAADAGRSPESYTILGENPTDPVVEWAARNFHRLKQAAGDAKKAADLAETLLEGIPAGTYGEMEVRNRTRLMPDYKRGFNILVANFELPIGLRPPVENLEEPPKRTDRWVEVKPAQRKAETERRKRQKTTTPDTSVQL